MEEFFQNYGMWFVLAAAFVAMHWFGVGCCGSHRAGGKRKADADGSADEGKPRADQPGRGKGCH